MKMYSFAAFAYFRICWGPFTSLFDVPIKRFLSVFVRDIEVTTPEFFTINDNMIDIPANIEDSGKIEVLKGPNIKEFPTLEPMEKSIETAVSIKVGDNITTDHISPAGASLLPFRSNIPYLSDYCFSVCDRDFPKRAREHGISAVVGGENYGQGSSREHASLVPLYLGVRVILVKSFARIHRDNLANAGILPLVFKNKADYDRISEGDILAFESTALADEDGESEFTVVNKTTGERYGALTEISDRQKKYVLAGGLLGFTKQNG